MNILKSLSLIIFFNLLAINVYADVTVKIESAASAKENNLSFDITNKTCTSGFCPYQSQVGIGQESKIVNPAPGTDNYQYIGTVQAGKNGSPISISIDQTCLDSGRLNDIDYTNGVFWIASWGFSGQVVFSNIRYVAKTNTLAFNCTFTKWVD